MKKEKKRRLCKLYLGYTFDKATLVLILVAIIFLVGALILVANPFIDKNLYLEAYKDIHIAYFNQGIFVISIFNALIIAMIALRLTRESVGFDSLFISYLSRHRICGAKILAGFIFTFLLIAFEVIILISIPIALYSRYKLDINILWLFIYLLAGALIEVYASFFFTTLISSTLVPLLIAFIDVVLRILTTSFSKLNSFISYLLPVINIKDSKFICNSIYFTPLWIIGFMLLYIGTYEIRDLKGNL